MGKETSITKVLPVLFGSSIIGLVDLVVIATNYAKQCSSQRGYIKDKDFETLLSKLQLLPNVSSDFKKLVKQVPLVHGNDIPQFWY